MSRIIFTFYLVDSLVLTKLSGRYKVVIPTNKEIDMDIRLHEAVINGDMLSVIMLSSDQAELVVSPDEFGRLPIHLSLYAKDAEISRYLLNMAPESLSHKDLSGNTPADYDEAGLLLNLHGI